MAHVIKDRVRETSVTTGTGSYTLAGAVAGFQAFSVVGNGNTCFYAAVMGASWEIGLGTWATGGTLARTTIIDSSNSGSAVSWAAGTKDIFITVPGAKNFSQDASGNLVMPKTSGVGVKVDEAAPTFGWHDLVGTLHARASGAAVPTVTQYAGTSIYQYQYSNAATQELFIEFHLPHDYLPGSDVFVHAHWSQTTVDTGGAAAAPGVVKWSFDALYAKGHQQQAFQNAVTTVSATQTCSSTIRQHMISEAQLSTSGAIGSNALEVDGLILLRAWRDPADAADTANVAPFLHTVDLHYQSTNLPTKQKAPNFYV